MKVQYNNKKELIKCLANLKNLIDNINTLCFSSKKDLIDKYTVLCNYLAVDIKLIKDVNVREFFDLDKDIACIKSECANAVNYLNRTLGHDLYLEEDTSSLFKCEFEVNIPTANDLTSIVDEIVKVATMN